MKSQKLQSLNDSQGVQLLRNGGHYSFAGMAPRRTWLQVCHGIPLRALNFLFPLPRLEGLVNLRIPILIYLSQRLSTIVYCRLFQYAKTKVHPDSQLSSLTGETIIRKAGIFNLRVISEG